LQEDKQKGKQAGRAASDMAEAGARIIGAASLNVGESSARKNLGIY
jgi:hypothetical protein